MLLYLVLLAIFMFAGGTSATFEEFQEKAKDEANKPLKLTDFVSRLLGFLNLRDINPPTKGIESESQRLQRQVKRALTLEFQLRDHVKDIIDGSSGKLRVCVEKPGSQSTSDFWGVTRFSRRESTVAGDVRLRLDKKAQVYIRTAVIDHPLYRIVIVRL